jgi:hypothetical protein
MQNTGKNTPALQIRLSVPAVFKAIAIGFSKETIHRDLKGSHGH